MTNELTTTPTTDSSTSHTSLKKSLGVRDIVFFVVAAAAPLTAIGGSLPVSIAVGNGAGMPASYVIIGVILLIFSVGYAAMSKHVVNAGAFYAYVSQGIGKVTGTGAAGLALLAYTAVQAAVYGIIGQNVSDLVTKIGGPTLPWWTYCLVLAAIAGSLGYRDIELGAKVLGVLLILETVIVVVVSVAVLVKGGAHGINLDSFTPHAFFSGAPGIGLMFAVASFVGFEATSIYGEEAKDPTRAVPKATYIAVILIGVFYALTSWAMVLGVGVNEVQAAATADPVNLVFTIARNFVGGPVANTMQFLMISSMFAALLAFHNAISRYLFSLGREGSLPKKLSNTHLRHNSPHIASLTQSASAIVVFGAFAIAGADPVLQLFSWLSGVATLAILLLMILVSVAVFAFFWRTKADERLWHARVAPLLGTIGLIVVTVLVVQNFALLIGGSTTLAFIFEAIIAASFVIGALIAVRQRTR